MNVNKNNQRYSVTDNHLEDILKTSTSCMTPKYDLVAEKICTVSHYVCKVIRKSTNVFFQLNILSLFNNSWLRIKIIENFLFNFVRKLLLRYWQPPPPRNLPLQFAPVFFGARRPSPVSESCRPNPYTTGDPELFLWFLSATPHIFLGRVLKRRQDDTERIGGSWPVWKTAI